MSDEVAFLAAIAAAPADDAPRLVYADWLDENGRAEQAAAIRAEREYRAAVARWEDLRARTDPDWRSCVFPAETLVLRACPMNQKLEILKLIRSYTGCDLREARELAELLPSRPKRGFWVQSVERYRRDFAALGADVVVEIAFPDRSDGPG